MCTIYVEKKSPEIKDIIIKTRHYSRIRDDNIVEKITVSNGDYRPRILKEIFACQGTRTLNGLSYSDGLGFFFTSMCIVYIQAQTVAGFQFSDATKKS
jgi:hypothetical protein